MDMETISLIKEALCALTTGDIERHLSYISDDVVYQQESIGEHIEGIDSYREYIERPVFIQYVMGFYVIPPDPAHRDKDARLFRAVLYVLDIKALENGSFIPEYNILNGELLLEVWDGSIHKIDVLGTYEPAWRHRIYLKRDL